MTSIQNAICAATLLAFTGFTNAAPLTVVSYDAPNGASGFYNYFDDSYSGSGDKHVNGAALSGGTGDLTDGVTTDQGWFDAESPDGPGPYVGWWSDVTPELIVKFNFAGPVLINSVTIHMDDSNGQFGVAAPDAIEVSSNGVDYVGGMIDDPAGSSPFALTLPINLTSSEIFVRFSYRDQWIFVDEISFDGEGNNNVPEPALPALLGLGLAAIGFLRRKS